MVLKEKVFKHGYVRMYSNPENANIIGRSLFSVAMNTIFGMEIIDCGTYDEAEKLFNKFIDECL